MKHNAWTESVLADLDALCGRHGLAIDQRDRLMGILVRLAEVDGAPTTVREPRAALRVHLADSLVALELDVVRSARAIADLGAGAGFPGLPLAVALPASKVRLIESQRRKCGFVEGVCRAAGISNATTVCVRAEEWGTGMRANDLVLARALAPAAVVLEYAAPLLTMQGTLVDWRGRRDVDEDLAATKAAAELGMRLVEIRRVEPYPEVREHHLHLYSKVAPTPERFPRRSGVARKHPLGC